jgi:hypothetical protein
MQTDRNNVDRNRDNNARQPGYEFRLGTTGPGPRDVYNSAEASTTALTTGVITVPTNGVTLYARIYSYINGVSQYKDYIYKEAQE